MNPSKKEHMSLAINDVSQEEKERNFYIDEEIFKKIKSEPSGAFTTKLYGKMF